MAGTNRSPLDPPDPDPDQTQRLPELQKLIDQFLKPWPEKDRDQPPTQ